MTVAFRFEKIDELFNKIMNHTCELVKTSNASFLEIAIATTYISKALLKIIALSGSDMAKVADTVEETLGALDSTAIQEVVDFIRKNTIGEKEIPSHYVSDKGEVVRNGCSCNMCEKENQSKEEENV